MKSTKAEKKQSRGETYHANDAEFQIVSRNKNVLAGIEFVQIIRKKQMMGTDASLFTENYIR